jgi:tetratricopeptide (TPR) repeat protein
MPGTLAHYEIFDPLGRGGMGEVFLARDTRLDRQVALKVLPPEMASDPDRLERFRREARAVAALNHPNIVTIYSVEEADGQHFLTMERVEGGTLEERVPREGLPAADFLALATQIADALRAAHARGVTHRDLKPGNIMVDGDDRIRVLDFGLAKVQKTRHGDGSSTDDAPTETLTQEGLVMGTLPYMSPEQVQGRAVDSSSDVFSLGILLYEMLCGQRPFAGESSAELVSCILRDDPSPIEHRDLGQPLDGILTRCLHKDPKARCTAEELWNELRQLRSGLDSGFVSTPGAPTKVDLPDRQPLVGRHSEMHRLQTAVEGARASRGALVLLTGEAGVGKTRLWQEAYDRARQSGFLALVGHCRDMEGAQPYLPLIEQIEAAARLVPPQALRRALGPNAPEVAKLMPDLRQRFDDIPEPVQLPADQERRYVLHGVSEFIERAARAQPMLLVYEDLHWADDSTLFLVRHLAQRLWEMPVLVVGTYRDTELAPGSALATVLQDLTRERLVEEILLQRLELDDVAQLLEDRAGRTPPPDLVARVFRETEGNPFFVEEIYRHLSETHQLFDDAGEWRSGMHRAEAEVPRSVGLVIGQRLERVSDDCRKALTAAAVVGRRFRFDVLATVASTLDEDQLLDAIEEAEGASLVEDASSGREAGYAFVHEQLRQALLSDLSMPRRQRLHLRVADALEAAYGSRVEARATELAHHLYQAGAAADEERTLRYQLLAADSTRDALAFEEALRWLQQAQEVMDDGDSEAMAGLLLRRALTERALARVDEALATFEEALATSPRGPQHDEILSARAQLLLDLFRGREAAEDLGALLEAARRDGDRERELGLLLSMARAHYVLSLDEPGQHAQMTRDTYEAAYELAKELGDRRGMARALIPTSWFTDYWSDYFPTAVANLEEALRLARELGDEELELEALTTQLRLKPPTESARDAERVRRRLEERRDPIRLKELYFLLMWGQWWRGKPERCREVCDAGIELAAQLGTDPVQYPTIKALALIDMGRFDEAWQALEAEVADDEHRFGHCMQQLGVAFYQARLESWQQAAETARWTLVEAGELSRIWMQAWMRDLLAVAASRLGGVGEATSQELTDGDPTTWFRAFPELEADALLAQGDAEAALAKADEMAGKAEKRGTGRTLVCARELALRSLVVLERWPELLAMADGCLPLAESAEMHDYTWRIRAHRARALQGLGRADDAAHELERARALLEQIGGTIPQAELRRSFLSQELAHQVLTRATDTEES